MGRHLRVTELSKDRLLTRAVLPKHTSALRNGPNLRIATAQPPFEGGRARCFELWMTGLHQATKLCHGIDSCCTATRGPQWAVTPKLTMIAGRQLSIGALSV
jgi:hypothetical protein